MRFHRLAPRVLLLAVLAALPLVAETAPTAPVAPPPMGYPYAPQPQRGVKVFDDDDSVFKVGKQAPEEVSQPGRRAIATDADKTSADDRRRMWSECSTAASQRDCYNGKRERAANDLEKRLQSPGASRKAFSPSELTGEKKNGGGDY